MTLFTPCRLVISNFVLVSNLGCYLPVLPIIQAFALAIFAVYFPANREKLDAIRSENLTLDEIEDVKKRRLVLISKIILTCSCLVVTLLIVHYKSYLKRKLGLISSIFLVKLMKFGHLTKFSDNSKIEGSNLGEDKISEEIQESVFQGDQKTVSTTKHALVDRFNCNSFEFIVTNGRLEPNDIDTSISLASSVNTTPPITAIELLNNSETLLSNLDTCTLTDNLSHELDDTTASDITELPVNGFDDSGICLTSSRIIETRSPKGTTSPVLKSSSVCYHFSENEQTNCRSSSKNENKFSYEFAGKTDESLYLDQEYKIEWEEAGNEDYSDVEAKTTLAVKALENIHKECGSIRSRLEKLGNKHSSNRVRLEDILMRIEETDV